MTCWLSRLSAGLTTLPHKKLVTEKSKKETVLSFRDRRPPLENARTLLVCGESRKEATSPMPFLSTKDISKVGTWNVRTMYEANKTAQIARKTSIQYQYPGIMRNKMDQGYEFGLEIESVLGKFEKTIYNDI